MASLIKLRTHISAVCTTFLVADINVHTSQPNTSSDLMIVVHTFAYNYCSCCCKLQTSYFVPKNSNKCTRHLPSTSNILLSCRRLCTKRLLLFLNLAPQPGNSTISIRTCTYVLCILFDSWHRFAIELLVAECDAIKYFHFEIICPKMAVYRSIIWSCLTGNWP